MFKSLILFPKLRIHLHVSMFYRKPPFNLTIAFYWLQIDTFSSLKKCKKLVLNFLTSINLSSFNMITNRYYTCMSIYTSQIHYRHTNINRCSRLRWDFKIQKVEKNLQKCWSLLSSSETNAGKLKALKRDGRESSQQRINWWTKVYLWHSPGPKVESNCELKSIRWRVLVSPHFRHFQCSHPAHSATSG